MKMKVIASTAAVLLASATALAQPAPPPRAPDRPDSASAPRVGAQRRQEEAQDLRVILNLRADQQAALTEWLEAMAPPERRPPAKIRADAARTTLARLDAAEARLREMQSREHGRIEATRRFYTALDPQQQRIFDALDRMRSRPGRGRSELPPPR